MRLLKLITMLALFIFGGIATIIGLKNQDAMMLGMGIFLLYGELFWEVLEIKDQVRLIISEKKEKSK